ncbi:MAG: hypothetical protein HY601_01310 [Candidatus Omnitrophica bacterium]|nr:hypothetical protein [Candidatus Omnitrophota bacterium]
MAEPPGASTSRSRWYHSVWFVLAMLFFVMGPFALPLLWKSPRFALWAKVALTLALAGATWWALATGVALFRQLMEQSSQWLLLSP